MVSVMIAILVGGATAGQAAPTGPRSLWGYVDNVDGMVITLDDGTLVKLTDITKVTNVDGTEGTPADVVKGVKVLLALDAAGNATRAELLPKPIAMEFYLTSLTVRGATNVAAEVKGRTYPRSLSATKASFPVRGDCVAFEGGVAYLPPKEAKAPPSLRFTVVDAAQDPLYQRTLDAGEVAAFRLNIAQGQTGTFTLLASAGDAAVSPEWCLWLDPKLVGAAPAPAAVGVYQSTVRALLADLKRGLQERQPEPMAIPLFVGLRVPDDQALRDLQEDLVVAATGQFPVAGKSNQRPELGLPLSDGVRAEFTKLGAKCALVGSVSLRGEMTVVNAALVDLGNGEILATARAWQ